MANVEKISIALTQDMAQTVRKAVESGEYATSSEVVREALRDWKQKRDVTRAGVEELGRLWAEGVVSGRSAHTDIEAVIAEAKRRASKK